MQIIPIYLMEMLSGDVQYDKVYKRLPKSDEHVEKLLQE
jgi:hypothetical protein